MIRVRVKNNGVQGIIVPFSSICPNGYDVVADAAPDAEACCSFLPPTDSATVQDALLVWAAAQGLSIGLAFEAAPPHSIPALPPPAPGPGSPIMDPLNPLGI